MSIQDELNQIKNAVYGADVRDAIHDSIKKTYDDASANGNANMEVEMARGTEPTLSARLDKEQQEVNAQLAQKADKSEVTNVMTPKGNTPYASLPTTGNSVGDYYYCPDGDGVNPAGNYVWNGTTWYFGGTIDEGYSKLKGNLDEITRLTSGYENVDITNGTLDTSKGYYDAEGNFMAHGQFDIRIFNSNSNYNVKVSISSGSFCFNVIRNGVVAEGYKFVEHVDYNITEDLDGFVISYNRYESTPSIVKHYDNSMDEQISNLNNIILIEDNVIDPTNLEWVFGHLGFNGNYYDNNNKNICTRHTHLLNSGTKISVDNGYKMQIALFTTNDVYVNTISWGDNYTLDSDYKCRIEVSTENEDVQSDFSVATSLSIIEPQNSVKANTQAIKEINETLSQPMEGTLMYEMDSLVNNIGLDFFKGKLLEIVNRDKFNVWPMLTTYKDGLICFYVEADQHEATVANPYYTISTNGVSWSKSKNMFPIQNERIDVTGAGVDDDGNPLVWVRYNVRDFKLYKYDGTDFNLVSTPTLSMTRGHISNIFKAEGCLMCFWDSFNPVGSWGVLKSFDNGVTWTETVVENGLSSSEKPTEISGVYLGDNKILAIGRRDYGPTSMVQLQSTDNGATWTKAITNIDEDQIAGNTPALIYDSDSDELSLYYYHRNEVTVKKREALLSNVWDSPLSWGNAVNLHTFDHAWVDGGNLQAIKYKGYDYLIMYDATVWDVNSGIYSMIIHN